MKASLGIVLLLTTAAGIAQQASIPNSWIYGYVNGRSAWLTLGPTLTIAANGQIDAVPPSIPKRMRDVLLTYDATARAWNVPAGARNVALYVNGIRYRSQGNWSIDAGKLTASNPDILPEHELTADFDQ